MKLSQYRSTLTQANLMNASTVCPIGVPTKIGEYVVNAKEVIELGYGNGGQDSATGRIFMDIEEAGGVDVEGRIRIIIASPQDIPLAVVFEARTEELRSGASNVSERMPFNAPELHTQVTEDNKIQLWFTADATKTVTQADSVIVASISRYIPV